MKVCESSLFPPLTGFPNASAPKAGPGCSQNPGRPFESPTGALAARQALTAPVAVTDAGQRSVQQHWVPGAAVARRSRAYCNAGSLFGEAFELAVRTGLWDHLFPSCVHFPFFLIELLRIVSCVLLPRESLANWGINQPNPFFPQTDQVRNTVNETSSFNSVFRHTTSHLCSAVFCRGGKLLERISSPTSNYPVNA